MLLFNSYSIASAATIRPNAIAELQGQLVTNNHVQKAVLRD